MPIPVFTQVIYLSPWFPLPPGWSKVGVDAVVAPPSGSGQVLAGRLRQGDTTLLVGVGISATEVVLVPTSPLSAVLSYFVDVQWVASGTQPGSIVWTTPNTVATSPIVTAVLSLTEASIAGSTVALGWDFGATALTPAGANITAFNSAGKSIGFSRVQGVTGTMTLGTATAGSQLYLQGVMPVSGTPGTGFTEPFTMGPIISGAPLPVTAPTITAIVFDGGTVQVTWTAPTAPTAGGAVSYELVASTSGATPAATVFEASAGGGVAVLGPPGPGGWAVAGRVRIGPVIGVAGTPIALLTQIATLDQIAVKSGGSGVTARVTFPAGTPAGATALVELVKGGTVAGSATVGSSGGTADITASGVTGPGWQLRARLQLTASGASLSGPLSGLMPVMTAAPTITDISMIPNPTGSGGWIVTVIASTPPPTGATLLVSLSQGSTSIASQTINATKATFSLTQGNAGTNRIDGTVVANASLNTVSATATSPSSVATFIGAIPTPTAIQNIGAADPSGQPQGLQVDVAAGGTSGQMLAIQLTVDGKVMASSVGATSTHANLPLSQPLDPSLDWRIQARWTGNGVTEATFGGWSTPVAVLTATTAVARAAYDNGQLSVTIEPPQGVAPAQGAYLYACKTTGGSITGTSVIGTSGTFALNPGADTWQAAAKPFQPLPAGAGSRTLAPSSALAPLLITAPTLASISYDGDVLAANWNVVSDAAGNAATGAVIEVSDGTGSVLTTPAGSSSGEIAVRLPASTQGQVKLRVRATRATASGEFSGAYCTAVPPLVAAPTPGSVALGTDNQQRAVVNAVLTTPSNVPSGTTYRAWLMAGDRIAAGPVDAVTNQGVTSVSLLYAAAGVVGLAVVAQAQATNTTPTLAGPRSAPAPVLTLPPRFGAVLISPVSQTEWQLSAAWQPPSDGAAIVSYTLTLTKNADSSVVAHGNFGPGGTGLLSFAMSGVTATSAYTLSLVATSANSSTTPVASTPIWFATAAFTAVTVDQTQVNAQWTAPSGPTGIIYQLRLLDGATSAVLATTTTAATSGGLGIAGLGLTPGGNYVLDLGIQIGPTLFEAGSDGTYKTRPVLLLSQPTGLKVATDAATGKATLSWTAISGASGYTVNFSDGRDAVPVGSASYTFAAALAANTNLRVSVTANVAANAVTSTGPASAPLAIPTLAPALTRASYNGANVFAAWQPAAGAVGYVATILSAAGTATASSPQTAATSVSFQATLTSADGPYTVVVQAVTEAGSGLPSAALPVFQTAWFVSTEQPSAEPPNIYPAATLALDAAQISIFLPPLANGAIAAVSPIGPFDLQTNTGSTKDAFPYILVFAANSDVWKFSAGNNPLPPIRPQLQSDYVTFLQAAETAGAAPWGISVLQQAISRWMPQTFVESHYYAYGLNLTGGPGTGSIDLRQGLVLRIGFANYTNVWSGDANSWLNGFGGGSPSDFDVGDCLSGAGSWQLAMDAFIAAVTASGAMSVAPPSTIVATADAAGVADAADLFFPTFPNPFYRLFFPRQLENPTSTGSVSTAANFALASAATYKALNAATPTPGSTAPVTFFRGRAVLRLMIRVSINDVEVVVPLGTTVGNVLDRYGVRPPATGVQLAGVSLERAGGPGIAVFGASPAQPPLTFDSATRRLVRLDWSTMATYGGPVDATNLPLLHGDRIAF